MPPELAGRFLSNYTTREVQFLVFISTFFFSSHCIFAMACGLSCPHSISDLSSLARNRIWVACILSSFRVHCPGWLSWDGLAAATSFLYWYGRRHFSLTTLLFITIKKQFFSDVLWQTGSYAIQGVGRHSKRGYGLDTREESTYRLLIFVYSFLKNFCL